MNSAEQQFTVESGGLAIVLLNTVRRDGEHVVDTVAGPAELLAWLDATGLGRSPGPLTDALRQPPGARILLTEAHNLREELRGLFEARRAGAPARPHLLYGLNRVLRGGRITVQVRVESDEARLLEREAGEGPLAVLAPVARDAARLLLDVDPRRIRRCAAEDCRRWFVDTSKGGRRRWCSMATCGNRAKAARHRRRAEVG
jgi:predicted RNA-binding Zn ribbon-like protein